MSRWTVLYNAIFSDENWTKITNKVSELKKIESTNSELIIEICRLEKVIRYIDEIHICVDAEYFSMENLEIIKKLKENIINELNNFDKDKLVCIVNTNKIMDKILEYFYPYSNLLSKSKRSASLALKIYNETLESMTDNLMKRAETQVKNLKNIETNIVNIKKNIEQFSVKLFDDAGEEKSLSTKINNFAKNISEKNENINKIYRDIFSGSEGESSIRDDIFAYKDELEGVLDDAKTKISETETDMSKKCIEITTNLDNYLTKVEEKKKDLLNFYHKIFGEPQEDGSLSGCAFTGN